MMHLMPLTAEDALHFEVRTDSVVLDGTLLLPAEATGVVIFAHASGTGRLSPTNCSIASQLSEARFATLLIDLLTIGEAGRGQQHQHMFGDLALLNRRLLAATDRIRAWPETSGLPLGYFGVGLGTAAALLASVERPDRLGAIVSCFGMPDLAASRLRGVRAPTLLIVGGEDNAGITRNDATLAFLPEGSSLALIPGTCKRFDRPGVIDQLTWLATRWFGRFLV